MRLTVRLDDALHREAKRYALEHVTMLTALIGKAPEEKLAKAQQTFKCVTFQGNLRPGVDLSDNAALLDLMEEGLDIT